MCFLHIRSYAVIIIINLGASSSPYRVARALQQHPVPVSTSPLFLAFGSHCCTLCLHGVVSSGPFVSVESHNMQSSVTAFLIWRTVFKVSSVLHFCLLLNNISLYGVSTFFYLFIIWWTFGLFSIIHIVNNAAVNTHVQVLRWTYVSFLLGIYL